MVTGRDERLGRSAEADLGRGGRGARSSGRTPPTPRRSTPRSSEAVALLGGLDVLVNNAGIGVAATPLDTPLADFDSVMDVNVRGCFRYAQACFPYLEARGGSMIHIGSDAGVLGEVDDRRLLRLEGRGAHAVERARDRGRPSRRALERDRARATPSPACGTWAPPGATDRPEDDPVDLAGAAGRAGGPGLRRRGGRRLPRVATGPRSSTA